MGEIAAWLGLAVSTVTLGFVASDWIRQRRRLAGGELVTHVVRNIELPGEGRCDVLDIANRGSATVMVAVYSFAKVNRLIQASAELSQATGDAFTPRFTLAPGQGFSVILPPEVPPDAWVQFLFTDTDDPRSFIATWRPVFSEFGPEFVFTKWQRLVRAITPPRFREYYPVGPGGAPAMRIPRGPRTAEALEKAGELLQKDEAVQIRNRWSSEVQRPE